MHLGYWVILEQKENNIFAFTYAEENFVAAPLSVSNRPASPPICPQKLAVACHLQSVGLVKISA